MREARHHLGLDRLVVRPEHPVGTALHHRIADALEALDGARRSRRPKRIAEALVAPLMPVQRLDDLGIVRLARFKRDTARHS